MGEPVLQGQYGVGPRRLILAGAHQMIKPAPVLQSTQGQCRPSEHVWWLVFDFASPGRGLGTIIRSSWIVAGRSLDRKMNPEHTWPYSSGSIWLMKL